MQIQTTPLDDQENHCLDSMVEFGELDGGTYLAIVLYADRGAVSDIFHQHEGIGWRTQAATLFTEMADDIVSNLPLEIQGYLIYSSLACVIRTLESLASVMADWALTDSCEGGALTPFKKNYKHLRDYRIPNKTKRRLYSKKWIRRYVKRSREVGMLNTVLLRIGTRMEHVPPQYIKDGDDFFHKALAWQLYRTPLRESRAATQGRAEIRRRRRALNRSLVAARSVVPEQTLKAFVNREEISVTGKNLVLKLRRTSSVLHMGHGAFAVAVYDLNNTHLANLCVYFEDTPVIDQLLGVMLYVSSGCEDEFVRAANVTFLSKAGADHYLLKGNAKVVNEAMRRVSFNNRHIPYDVLHTRRQTYWNDTKDLWIEALSGRLLGRYLSKTVG